MNSLEIVSYRNHPKRGAWALLFMSLLVFVINRYVDTETKAQEYVLSSLPWMFALLGIWIFIWAPKRVVRIRPGRKHLVIEDTSCFGKKVRMIPSNSISAVVVFEWKDTHPDVRPFGQTYYWVVVRLQNGDELAVTDKTLIQEEADGVRRQLTEALTHIS